MANLIKTAGVEDVLPGQAVALTVAGQRIALFNVGGTYYAIGDSCAHGGGPMSEGEVQGTKVACPWHGADFDLKAGVGRIVRCGGKELALELEENGYDSIINGAAVPA